MKCILILKTFFLVKNNAAGDFKNNSDLYTSDNIKELAFLTKKKQKKALKTCKFVALPVIQSK